MFLSHPSRRHGRESALPCRRPEAGAVKDCVDRPCSAWGCGRRCCQFGLGLASPSWPVPAPCPLQRCCDPRSLLSGCGLQAWGRVPRCPRPGCREGRVKEDVPKGVTSCPETSAGHREPRSPAQELPSCWCLERPGEGGGSPARGRARPSCLLHPPRTALPAPIPACPPPRLPPGPHRNTPRDRLLLGKPQLCRPLCSSSLRAAAGCRGRAAGVLINILFSILAFPCLGLLCSGSGRQSS